LSECLAIDQGSIRVISPDVGGGFGYKGILLPEEVALAWLCRRLGRPVRWIEDRREQLSANANCREHHYDIALYADDKGRILGLECDATVDSGAYSSYPFSACLEAAQVSSILPGPYRMERYRCKTWSVATNKPPILPYRGVARTGVCFALEVTLDSLARKLGRESNEIRFKSLVRPEQMPFDNIAKRHFDSGDYPEALRRAVETIGFAKVRERQKRGEPDGRRIGIGFAMYSEQAGHGTSVYAAWGIPMVPGHEPALARFTPDGGVVGPAGRIAVADVARTWYRRPQDLPGDVNASGLEVTAGYKAKRDTGTFSYAAHAAVVAVDPETGELEILDYVVVEDGGTL